MSDDGDDDTPRDDEHTVASTDSTADAPAPFLVTERVGKATYVGRNERGATVRIGPEGDDGVFSPGELLAVAVAACTGMSADSRVSWELGDDVPISVGVSRIKAEGENRYERFAVELVVTAPHQDAARQQRMLATARKAIEQYCTVSRTLEASAAVALSLTAEGGTAAPSAPPA